jgi:uncharacterized protein (DUF1015 family)
MLEFALVTIIAIPLIVTFFERQKVGKFIYFADTNEIKELLSISEDGKYVITADGYHRDLDESVHESEKYVILE